MSEPEPLGRLVEDRHRDPDDSCGPTALDGCVDDLAVQRTAVQLGKGVWQGHGPWFAPPSTAFAPRIGRMPLGAASDRYGLDLYGAHRGHMATSGIVRR